MKGRMIVCENCHKNTVWEGVMLGHQAKKSLFRVTARQRAQGVLKLQNRIEVPFLPSKNSVHLGLSTAFGADTGQMTTRTHTHTHKQQAVADAIACT
jgi:hypothetical protein